MRYLIVSVLALLIAMPAYAQVELNGPSLYLAVSPQYPKPGDALVFTIQSPLSDLSTRLITWKNSDTVVLEGEGESVYRVNAPTTGERMDISVMVEGIADTPAISIVPSSVDLLWESDSYAPGLYRGRHLASLGSTITLQALPHLSQKGIELPSSQLIFTWKQNGQIVQSGKGKTSISIPVAAFVDTSTITVNVTTSDKSLGADRSTTIHSAQPTVRLYFEHPLYGTMLHSALPAQLHISDTEASFAAIPYFAEAKNANDKLFSYLWRVNRATVDPNDEQPNTITINAGSGGANARIELSLSHKKNFELDARGVWDVSFGSIGSVGSNSGPDPFTGE